MPDEKDLKAKESVNKDEVLGLVTAYLSGIKNADRVSGAGIAPKEIFTLTGEFAKAQMADGTEYTVLKTVEGRDLSIRQVMGQASLSGYEFDQSKEFPHQYFNDAENADGTIERKVVTLKVKPTIFAGFDSKTWKACPYLSLRNFSYAYFPYGDDKPLKGVKVMYCGKAVRPYTAKTNSKPTNTEKYEAGMERVIETSVWSVMGNWPTGRDIAPFLGL